MKNDTLKGLFCRITLVAQLDGSGPVTLQAGDSGEELTVTREEIPFVIEMLKRSLQPSSPHQIIHLPVEGHGAGPAGGKGRGKVAPRTRQGGE